MLKTPNNLPRGTVRDWTGIIELKNLDVSWPLRPPKLFASTVIVVMGAHSKVALR